MGQHDPGPIAAERIENAMILCAYLVARDADGAVYAPILERLEAEYNTARAVETPQARARRLLQSRTIPPAAIPRIVRPAPAA